MNNFSFNPVRGVRTTLAALGSLSTSACDGLVDLNPGMGDEAARKALKDAMLRTDLVTNTASNPAGTVTHLNLIMASPGTGWIIDGELLTSTGLPWQAVSTTPQTPTMATGVSAATQAAITKTLEVGSSIASASAGVSVAQSLITGEESHADRVQRGIDTLLVDGGWDGTTWRVDAAFGVFGSLPLVGVTFDECYVLLDSVTGAMDGPFASATVLDGRMLLAAHVDTPVGGFAVRYFEHGGCPATFGKDWHPGPKPTTPATPPSTLTPAVPGGAGPPPVPPVPAGGTEPFVCKHAPGGGYKCERLFIPAPPFPLTPPLPTPPGSPTPGIGVGLLLVPPATTIARQICTTPGGCEPVGFPSATVPAPCGVPTMPGGGECPTPGPPPAPPTSTCAPTCRIEYWY